MVVICWVSNGKDMVLAPKQLQASYTDVRHWEELIDFIDKNRGPKEPYIMTSMFKSTLGQAELEDKYMGLYTNGQMIMDPIYGQISYTGCHSNGFKLKLGQDSKQNLVERMRATEKESAEHVIRLAKEIPSSHVKARCAQLLIITHRLWKVLNRVQERRERRMVRKSSIRQIPAQYWIRFSVQSTTNLNTSVLMRQSGCWMIILFVNQQVTVFQATNIQFQACPELHFWRTRFGLSGSSWGDGFGMPTCQVHWW